MVTDVFNPSTVSLRGQGQPLAYSTNVWVSLAHLPNYKFLWLDSQTEELIQPKKKTTHSVGTLLWHVAAVTIPLRGYNKPNDCPRHTTGFLGNEKGLTWWLSSENTSHACKICSQVPAPITKGENFQKFLWRLQHVHSGAFMLWCTPTHKLNLWKIQ